MFENYIKVPARKKDKLSHQCCERQRRSKSEGCVGDTPQYSTILDRGAKDRNWAAGDNVLSFYQAVTALTPVSRGSCTLVSRRWNMRLTAKFHRKPHTGCTSHRTARIPRHREVLLKARGATSPREVRSLPTEGREASRHWTTQFRVLGFPGGPLQVAGVWVLMVREMRLLADNRVHVQEMGDTGKVPVARGQYYRH